jgi:hypothetical protein
MNQMRSNWTIAGLYILASLGIFIAALVSPPFREIAKAPLRDWLLPPPAPVVVHLLYSTEKDAWLKEALQSFADTHPKVNGYPIQVTTEQMGSREMVLAVLDGKDKPDLISPAGMLQIAVLQDQSMGKFGHPLVNMTDQATCQSVVKSPLVLAAWKERADALWGPSPPPEIWKKLHDALVDTQGWGKYGHPDWGYIKFGHTNPLSSNSGLMTLLLMTYDYYGKTGGLTSADILGNQDFQKWMLDIEGTISRFGDSTGTYMRDMVAYGPSVYDFVSVYEATAFEQAQNAVSRYGELRVYYPPAMIQSDHPFCILNADWVTPPKVQAARMLIDYLLSSPLQELALNKYGFRPVNPAIPIDGPNSPLVRFAANGFKSTLSPEVQVPSADVINTLIDFWSRNVNR